MKLRIFFLRALFALNFAFLFSGCATSHANGTSESAGKLMLSARQDQLRKGDALILEAQLEWNGATPPPSWLLDTSRLEFWLANPDQTLRRLWPVAPDRDLPNGDLGGESPKRVFVFTQATNKAGDYTVMAKWRSIPPAGQHELPPAIWTEPVTIKVADEQAFERSNDGLITQAEAERLARHASHAPEAASCRATLADSLYGLHDWVVTVSPPGDASSQTVIVNPYLGTIRSSNRANAL